MGMSNVNIGKEFGVSDQTVAKSLSYLQRAGMLAKAEDTILQELVPEAVAEVKRAIADKNTEAAMKILEHVVFKRSSKKEQTEDADTLEAIITEIRRDPHALPAADGTRSITEGVILPSETEPPPAVAEEIRDPGSEDCETGSGQSVDLPDHAS